VTTEPATSPFRDRAVLVTGGTGSIGSEVVRRVLEHRPRVVRVLSRDDSKQFELAQELRDRRELRMLIGDIRSRDRIARAMSGIDLVIHAAAMKHVPACEYNPFEATETNVRGTQNVVEAAIDANVERVLNVSTDKAVDPTNVMGATKLLAERLTSSAQLYRGPAGTRFASVRFGNVIGSRGSIVPLILRQVAAGGPVTVTDPAMTRYLMPLGDAVNLCLTAMERMAGGEVFILKMPRVRIGDLVEVLVNEYASRFGHDPRSIAIERIGVRSGEKLDEALMTADEARRARDAGDMWIVPRVDDTTPTPPTGRDADPPDVLDRDGIRELLDRAGWLAPESLPRLA
jgi:UDP-N-acetylglucosamine 4,6-dehydratase/5-epimerase